MWLGAAGCFWKENQICIQLFPSLFIREDWEHYHKNGFSSTEEQWKGKSSRIVSMDYLSSMHTKLGYTGKSYYHVLQLKVIQDCKGPANPRGHESLLIYAEVFISCHRFKVKKII